MTIRNWVAVVAVLGGILIGVRPVNAEEAASALEKSMSETLDVWRDGQYERLFERLAHRGKTSREAFVNKMRSSTSHPACCWQKMENFKVLEEKRSEATVYVKIGLEGSPVAPESTTREYKLIFQEGIWKMQLADVFALAGVSGKKVKSTKKRTKKAHLYYN